MTELAARNRRMITVLSKAVALCSNHIDAGVESVVVNKRSEKVKDIRQEILSIIVEIQADRSEHHEDNKLRLSDRCDGPLRNAMMALKDELKQGAPGPARIIHGFAREKFTRQNAGKWISSHRFQFESEEEKLAFVLKWN